MCPLPRRDAVDRAAAALARGPGLRRRGGEHRRRAAGRRAQVRPRARRRPRARAGQRAEGPHPAFRRAGLRQKRAARGPPP